MRPLRPDDRDALRESMRRAQRTARLPVVLGGIVTAGQLRVTDFLGVRTNALRNLDVRSGAGLGGQALLQGRPIGVADYATARSITHDYDRPVLTEGLSSIMAVPVRVNGTCRAVLYGAGREPAPIGDRVSDVLVATAADLARELTVRDEVDRRAAMGESLATTRADLPGVDLEEVRALHAELRSIAGSLDDPALRARLHAVTARLAEVGTRPGADRPAVRLSPREIDALAQVALGCTNADAARRLGVTAETIKSYLHAAMRKLDVSSRHEAVVRARTWGLLP